MHEIETNQVLKLTIDVNQLVKELLPELRVTLKEIAKDLIYPESYLTRNEAAEFLKISLPTLDKYTNQGILTKLRIGDTKECRYKRSDLENTLNTTFFRM